MTPGAQPVGAELLVAPDLARIARAVEEDPAARRVVADLQPIRERAKLQEPDRESVDEPGPAGGGSAEPAGLDAEGRRAEETVGASPVASLIALRERADGIAYDLQPRSIVRRRQARRRRHTERVEESPGLARVAKTVVAARGPRARPRRERPPGLRTVSRVRHREKRLERQGRAERRQGHALDGTTRGLRARAAALRSDTLDALTFDASLPPQPPIDHEPSISWRAVLEIVQALALAVVISVVLNLFVVQVTEVRQRSMEPTLLQNDRVLVSKVDYRFVTPAPGDIVVFNPTIETQIPYVKRIIAIAGETVELRDGNL